MPPKQKRGEATIERLFAAALQVYASSGGQGFTVNAVSSASGVSLGSLYHHFGSFDGFTVALCMRCTEQLFDELTAAVTPTRTARSGIRALVVTYLRFIEENPDVALFLHSAVSAGLIEAHTEQIRSDMLGGIFAWVGRRVEGGDIAPLPGPVIEALAMGPVIAIARHWLAGPHNVDLDQAARALPDRIWSSLRPE
ncbi:TetR family transcriptional regulator [Nocardiopsis sp. Huas11]|uniref:TetR/AcrR family transcriptional regulator n=1 Tax=Nocardiopsis sp. Huas11 TaxID=2183912 RepID=UPI000EAD9E40|nr:TetR/AcrR family transcriptional regulator [Nocardiopsis sp. Huas11]RKS07132.1 TetR family transcriptional regulator [Nocardiopsis sp. Huas11]